MLRSLFARKLRGGAHLLRALAVLALIATCLVTSTYAQTPASALQVGVIASRTGGASAQGAAQWLLAAQRDAELRAAGGIFGVSVSVVLRDDAGDPARARQEAEALIDAGSLVIVCCTTPLATRAVAEIAEGAGVTLLAPTTFAGVTEQPYWAFSLAPDDTDALAAIVADAYRENRPTLALMALDGAVGDEAERDLAALLAVVGATLTHVERYAPGVRELRPEALVVAASQPGGVVVWGLQDDLLVAYEALRRRGYEGSVYARTALLTLGHAQLPWARLMNARVAVPPALAAPATLPRSPDTTAPQHGTWGSAGACAAAAFVDAERLAAVPGAAANAVATSPVLAALDLIESGLEQLIALQIPSEEPAVLRQALRDALVGLPALCTGAGLLDLRDGAANALDPAGLAIATVTSRGLSALP